MIEIVRSQQTISGEIQQMYYFKHKISLTLSLNMKKIPQNVFSIQACLYL